LVRLLLVSVGRSKAGPGRDLIERYFERAAAAGRSLNVRVELREIDESRARRPGNRKLEEAKAIRAALGPGAHIITCDESGKNLSSAEFAADLGRRRDQGEAVVALVLGGPDGFDAEFRASADLVIAFGAMTWPHQLARILAAEQIYRALTILAGHPYHRP
jgi:23S rRNA (pseudouridine1915-N3)-methyltransferase